MLDKYTNWLRKCPEATGVAIYPTSDRGPFPYQWRIESRDGLQFYGYVCLDGPAIAAPENEIRTHLCRLLKQQLAVKPRAELIKRQAQRDEKLPE